MKFSVDNNGNIAVETTPIEDWTPVKATFQSAGNLDRQELMIKKKEVDLSEKESKKLLAKRSETAKALKEAEKELQYYLRVRRMRSLESSLKKVKGSSKSLSTSKTSIKLVKSLLMVS